MKDGLRMGGDAEFIGGRCCCSRVLIVDLHKDLLVAGCSTVVGREERRDVVVAGCMDCTRVVDDVVVGTVKDDCCCCTSQSSCPTRVQAACLSKRHLQFGSSLNDSLFHAPLR